MSALQRYLDSSRQEEDLAELITPIESKDLYTIIIVKVAAITVNAHYGFYIHQTGYIPHEPQDNIYARESLIGIYNFLDSSECSLSEEKKVELYDELLDKFILLNEATVGWMSKPSESDIQYLEKCRQKTAFLKPVTQSPQENPSLDLEKIHQLTALITQHLCDAEKIYQKDYSTIKWIPKKIRTALDDDKKILGGIYHFVLDGPTYPLLSSQDCLAIVNQLIALFKRINDLVLIWSGKEDKDSPSKMSSCNGILMSGRGHFFDESTLNQKSAPLPEKNPITPAFVRPIKKNPTGGRISAVFQIATAAILACLVIVAYRHFYTKR
ncbi:MAG TPA: hypothetical protein VHK67_02275 [Rhabdochlamydiaceae bacterium]|jgi:hypothetical protein|nr:hypothetical protein [Rhabdochlamydiaceae bacterium]